MQIREIKGVACDEYKEQSRHTSATGRNVGYQNDMHKIPTIDFPQHAKHDKKDS